MATVTSDSSAKADSADDIRRQMAQIRQRLHQDMQGVVAGAEAASDWKHYVRMYPWVTLGAALAAGYFVIPRKRTSATKTAEKAADVLVAKLNAASEPAPAPAANPEPSKKGWIGSAIGLLGPLALRAAQSYALGYVETWIAQQQAAAEGVSAGPPPGPAAGRNPNPRM